MILHIDMDAFYAAIEIRDNPKLANLPVIVGGSADGRGVVSTANYIARKFGVHSAMPASRAKRLCPSAVFIRPRMNHYAAISKQIREIFESYTDLVEPLSLDEAFIDVRGSQALFGDATTIAKQIKARIRSEVGLTASAGIAPNKFLAKVASDLEKPDGLVVVNPNEIQDFLDPLPVTRVWGVGAQTQKKLATFGVHTIAELRSLSIETLKTAFGVNSQHFWQLARGIDSRPVVPDRDAKSISHETTFHEDLSDAETLRAWLLGLADQVARRMRRYEIVGKSIHLKVRYSNFDTLVRSRTLNEPTNTTDLIATASSEMFASGGFDLQRGVRLLGVGVSSLSTIRPVQLTLFDDAERSRSKRIDKASDQIRDQFGSSAIRRASSIRPRTD
jgi:DNA polymerase IV